MLNDDLLETKGIVCPSCKGKLLVLQNEEGSLVQCNNCTAQYPVAGASPLLLPDNLSSNKKNIQKFWKHLYHAAYEGHDAIKDRSKFILELDSLKKLFQTREHLAVNEMPIESLKGKKVLEIGPGAGAHSSLFSYYGADMTSMDITLDRVVSTQSKLDILDSNAPGVAVQGDAEQLPFEDNHFDIVYSNGVLHHTPDTEKAINEVYRILKPGGQAVIMLYAKHSYLYWINIFLLRGILLGNYFRGGNWLGRVTEWMSTKEQKIYNPETKVYTVKQIERIFNKYDNVEVRKGSFVFNHFPFVGKIISRILGIYKGYNSAGKLVYDHEWRNETALELLLGRYVGFNLNISAKKNK